MLERASRIHVIAWIDAHLLTVLCSHIGSMGGEVNISYQRLGIAICLQTGRDILHVLSLTSTLCRKAHQFATCVDNPLGLCYATLCIIGIHRCH